MELMLALSAVELLVVLVVLVVLAVLFLLSPWFGASASSADVSARWLCVETVD